MARLERLHLGEVVLPHSHPRATDVTCPIYGYVVEHCDGVIVFDTGVGAGHQLIDELYQPTVVPLIDALHGADIDERDVVAIVNSHLHFDHCGQNHLLPSVPVWVTEAERDMATAEFYTVPEWAAIPIERLRLSSDGEEIAAGVRIVHTPGHTPGHQSLAIDQPDGGVAIVAGQVCYTCAEFAAGSAAPADMHDESWVAAGADSLARLRAMDPVSCVFSHDAKTYSRPTGLA